MKCLIRVKIPQFSKLEFDREAERRAHGPAVEQRHVDFPQLTRAYDAAFSFGRTFGRVPRNVVKKIAPAFVKVPS